ncbi:uncharacterized protein LOC130818044 [Amaranthus tricolor]|uniref:uncharacterized protein LOC130818044 n=1 Tax=Amaranthus tricolor TaxID=29722 RepID=UPI002586C777|nr:uncharacterized protein LOC130818044 [Amaranthus tricolor]
MIKICLCSAKKSVVNVLNSKISYMLIRTTSFSSVNYNPQNIDKKKVDVALARSDPKVTTPTLDEDEETDGSGVGGKAMKQTRIVVETAFNVGEKMAEGMQETLGSIKDTTKRVKDTIVGNYDDVSPIDDHDHDHHHHHHPKVDKHVQDLRNKAGGYDKRLH